MTRTVRRLAALTLVVLLVSSSVAAPVAGASLGTMTGTAAIDSPDNMEPYTSGSGVCSYDGLFNLLGINLASTDCGQSAPDQTMNNTSKIEIYQDASELKSWTETTTTSHNNSLQNIQTTLYAYGEARQNALLKNGTTTTAMLNNKVNQTIADRVSKIQQNRINVWNQRVQILKSLVVARDSAGISIKYVTAQTTYNGWKNRELRERNFATTNITLANGSSTQINVFAIESSTTSHTLSDGISPKDSTVWSIANVPTEWWGTNGKTTGQSPFRVVVKPATSSDTVITLFKTDDHPQYQNWQTLLKKAALAKQNLAATASWKVDAYQAGELDLANATSPLTLAQEYSTSYAETGNLAYARATAAAAGYATPSLKNVSVMTVRDAQAGYNYTGALLSQTAPDNGTWMLGQQYNAAQIDGVQLVATTTGKTHTLQGNFTVTSMKNANGETLNQTHVRQYDYTVSNSSQYIQLQQELNELRETIANRTASGGTSDPGSGGGSGSLAIVGLLAVLAVAGVAYLQRDN
ncbi:hypothetical protein [Halarchaeum sp. P4]|uniref:hypothetical protein n=1 Tax=Halarchaeum sp. P4 TaxID=3421639 RepID=UPI003EB8B42D